MDVSQNSGTPKSSILIGFSIINHPFWGIPIIGNPDIAMEIYSVPIANIFFTNRQWRFLKSYVRFSEGNSSWICGMCSKKQGDEMINISYSCYDQNSKELNWESSSFCFNPPLRIEVDSQVSISPNKQRWSHVSDPKMTPCKSHPKNSPQKPWWGCNLRSIQWKAILAIPSLGKGLVGFDTSPGSAKSLLVAPMAFYVGRWKEAPRRRLQKRMSST